MARWPVIFLVLVACGPEGRDSGGTDSIEPVDAGDGFVDATPVDPNRPDGAPPGPCTDVVDVVFVLDVSSSMGFVLDKMRTEIGAVVDAANQLAPDSHFGLVAFADNHLLDTSGPLAGGKVHTAAGTLVAAFAQMKSTYTSRDRNPGDGPSGPTTQNPNCEENALDALVGAVDEFPWRDNATRVIIVATDDTFIEPPDNYGDRDQDGDTTSTDYPREGDYPAVHSLAAATAKVVGAKARIFSFTRLAPPPAPELFQCGTPRRFAWADISAGWSKPYQGAAPLPVATQGKNFDLALVEEGSLSLSATINEVVLDSFCNPPIE
jgi:hypothetical protein